MWAEASYLLDLMADAAKAQPEALVEHYGSSAILSGHLARLLDEVTAAVDRNKGTANLERCLRGDLKMIKVMCSLEKVLGVEVDDAAAVA